MLLYFQYMNSYIIILIMAPCCIKGCENRGEIQTKKNSGITYHLFPTNVECKRRWIKAIGRNDWLPSKVTVICSRHFDDNCFYTTQQGLVKLIEGAVPSINLHLTKTKNNLQDKTYSIIPDIPKVTDEDTVKTKELHLQLTKLLIIYEKQKRKLKNLRQKYRRRKEKLKNSNQTPNIENEVIVVDENINFNNILESVDVEMEKNESSSDVMEVHNPLG